MIHGSFGEVFVPQRDKSNISMYLTDICRTLTLDYIGKVTNHGVLSFRFAGTDRLFANATDNPDDWCFCSGGVCNPSGVANFSTCFSICPFLYRFHIITSPILTTPIKSKDWILNRNCTSSTSTSNQ